jgi:hypothetical protein
LRGKARSIDYLRLPDKRVHRPDSSSISSGHPVDLVHDEDGLVGNSNSSSGCFLCFRRRIGVSSSLRSSRRAESVNVRFLLQQSSRQDSNCRCSSRSGEIKDFNARRQLRSASRRLLAKLDPKQEGRPTNKEDNEPR